VKSEYALTLAARPSWRIPEFTMLPVAILAGGLATRLRPVASTIPKSLMDVNGEPFIAHQLRLLRENHIGRVVLCVGYLGELIRDKVGDGSAYGIQVEYVFDGSVPLGTGGAIKNALPRLGDAFLVLYGDSYLPCDYRAVQEAFLASGRLALMTVFRNEGLWDTSNVDFQDGRIVSYDKNNRLPQMRWIDYGLGMFHSAAFSRVPEGKAYDLALVYQDLLRQGELAGFETTERFYEIGSFDGLKETADFLASGGAQRKQ
jgi:MurNAc alpha-1-phosphate uridylyltransferase